MLLSIVFSTASVIIAHTKTITMTNTINNTMTSNINTTNTRTIMMITNMIIMITNNNIKNIKITTNNTTIMNMRTISACFTITSLEALPNTITLPIVPIALIPIFPILDPSPTFLIASIVPITAFVAIGTRTTFTKKLLISAGSSKFLMY